MALILDTGIAAPAAAYALRKLRAAYSGSAIRVIRASDNAQQDIGFSGDNLDTAALLTFGAGTNVDIIIWYDQSTNSDGGTPVGSTRKLTGDAGKRFRIVTAGALLTIAASGKPRSDTTANNQGYYSTTWTSYTGTTLTAVAVCIPGTQNYSRVIGITAGNNPDYNANGRCAALVRHGTAANLETYRNADLSNDLAITAATLYCLTARFTGTQVLIAHQNASATAASTSAAFATGQVYLGMEDDTGGQAGPGGTYCEAIVWYSDLGATSTAAVNADQTSYWLAIGGVTLTPAAGTGSATGVAPTIAAGSAVTLGVGSASATGLAPTALAASVSLFPVLGTAAATGVAPTLAAGVTIDTAVAPQYETWSDGTLWSDGTGWVGIGGGSATANGIAPTVSVSQQLPSTITGEAAADGVAPTVAASSAPAPAAGAAAATGVAGLLSVSSQLTSLEGTAAAAGVAPLASGNWVGLPAVGPAAAGGVAPTLTASSVATTAAGAAAADGVRPDIVVTGAIQADTAAGAAAASGVEPTLSIGSSLSTGVGLVNASGVASIVSAASVAATDFGSAAATGLAPIVAGASVAQTAVGNADAAGVPPTSAASSAVTTTTGHASAVGLGPTLAAGSLAESSFGEAAADGNLTNIAAGVHAAIAAGAAAATGIAPDLSIAGNRSVSPTTGDATADGAVPIINMSAIVDSLDPETAIADGVEPSWAENTIAVPDTGVAVADGIAPSILGSRHVAVEPMVGEAAADGLAPSVASITTIATDVGTAAATGLAPRVNASGFFYPNVGTATAHGIAPHFMTAIEQALTPATGTAIADGPAPIWRVAGFSATIADRGARSRFNDRSAFATKDKAA